jgi:hypothetical protein
MMRVIKSEWHQVEKRYSLIINRKDLEEIYPEYEDNLIDELYSDIINGDADMDQLIEDSSECGLYLDWDYLDEDWWTDRKGGYEVTYSVELDYKEPVPDWLRIRQLEEENERLRKLIDGEPIVDGDDDLPLTDDELSQQLELIKEEFSKLAVPEEKQKKSKKSKKKS